MFFQDRMVRDGAVLQVNLEVSPCIAYRCGAGCGAGCGGLSNVEHLEYI